MIRRLVVTYLAITTFGLALLAIPLGLTFAHREKDRLLVRRRARRRHDVGDRRATRSKPDDRPDERHPALLRKDTGGHVIVVEHARRSRSPTPTTDEAPRLRDAARDQGRTPGKAGHAAPATPTTLGTNARVRGGSGLDRRPGDRRSAHHLRNGDTRRPRPPDVDTARAVVPGCARRGRDRRVSRSPAASPARSGACKSATDRFAAGDLSARVEAEHRHRRSCATSRSTFNRMAGRLARLLDAQQRFVADASHQLRTPLTALRLRLENLASQRRRPRPRRDRRGDRGSGAHEPLIDGLLLLARDDASGHRHRAGRCCRGRARPRRHLAGRRRREERRVGRRATRAARGQRARSGRGRATRRQPRRQRARGVTAGLAHHRARRIDEGRRRVARDRPGAGLDAGEPANGRSTGSGAAPTPPRRDRDSASRSCAGSQRHRAGVPGSSRARRAASTRSSSCRRRSSPDPTPPPPARAPAPG